ncbi:hypothetical protein O4H61_00160 [Roseovarius aestuarii]|nr:hypothetical protein [Roseovarius aestuarii]
MASEQRTRTTPSFQRHAAIFGAAVIALGFVPVPLTDPSLPRATWFEWMIAVVPLLPLAVLLLSALSHQWLPAAFASLFAMVFWGIGAVVTFVMMALSGGGTEMVILHGVALTLACGTSILLASAIGQKAKSIAFGIFLFPVVVGVWSLAVMPIAYASALEISSGRAFCVGEHSPTENELRSISGLRGLSFYTTRSGNKIGDTWYFHGLLLVEKTGAQGVYNWSPRHMQFQAVERPDLLFANPLAACAPRKEFFQQLGIF